MRLFFCSLLIVLSFRLAGQGFVTNGPFIWRSALLPGWGQFYNEKPVSGFVFSIGVGTSIAGVIYAESQRSNNIRLSNQTSNLSLKRTHTDRAARWEDTRNLIGIVGLVFYVGNIIQASAMRSNVYAYQPRKLEFFAQADKVGLKLNF